MDDDDDDEELFSFANSKPLSLLDKDLYLEPNKLLEDEGILLNRQKRKGQNSLEGGVSLADQLLSGVVKKRKKREKVEEYDNDDYDEEENEDEEDEDEDDLLIFDSTSSITESPILSLSNEHCTPITMDDLETRKLIEAADMRLYSLRYPIDNDDTYNTSVSSIPDNGMIFNLRVRCRGKVHKFEIHKNDPLSCVCHKLCDKLKVYEVILQYKTQDLKPSDTVSDLNLSPVDILDGFVIERDTIPPVNVSKKANNDLCVKIQTNKKYVMFNINKSEPLERIMKEFAVEVGRRYNQIKFTFDGDYINGSQTPEELDIDNNDIIDALI